MSYKFQATPITPNHYVLPRVGGMLVEVHAFLNAHLYATSDEGLWQQAVWAASQPGAVGVYLMPDTHKGYSIPVGGVVVTDNTILQGGSGYDISCGVLYMRVPDLYAADIADFGLREKWVAAVTDRVATGVGSHRPQNAPKVNKRMINEVLRFGAKALRVSEALCERQYIPIDEDIDFESEIPKAFGKAEPQLGSVGGGNHFIEMQVDRDSGEVWLMVHCGSRGFGWQAADYFFHAGAALRGMPDKRREESYLFADEPLGKRYWAWHNAAANFAIANRHTIVHGVREATQVVFNRDCEVYFEISHNLVQQETLVLPDGTIKRGFVHRKGATRAFPAGHPDLIGTKWAETGHPCLIPGSMYEGAAILWPQAGAYQSGCSVNHGSGRVLGRGEAKRQLGAAQAEINEEMRTVTRTLGGVEVTGIASNCADIPLDECGHVYKDLDEVLGVLTEEGIARLDKRLYPVANLKGTD